MFKKIFFILFSFCVISTGDSPQGLPVDYYYNVRSKVEKIVKRYCKRKKLVQRYTDVIIRNAIINDMNPVILAKQIATESSFRFWIVSRKHAVGPMQVKPIFWAHLLYDYPELRRKLKKKSDYDVYLKRIGYNIGVGSRIMKYFLSKYGNYPLSLVAYCYGENSKEFKKCSNDIDYLHNNKYVKSIMGY